MPQYHGDSLLHPQNLPPSRHWELQWQRVGRWYARVDQLKPKIAVATFDEADLDTVLAFFTNCFHLRDWLLASRPDCRIQLDTFFSSTIEMGVCRDIANGFKHKIIRRPTYDPHFSFIREYNHEAHVANPDGDPVVYWVVVDIDHWWREFDLLELVDTCFAHWSAFLARLPEEPLDR